MGRGEGLLVLHIDTDLALSSIVISGATAVENLPVGVHTRIVAAPAGSYRWDRILPHPGGRGIRYQLPLFEDSWRFRVSSGRINYPGLLVLRKGGSGSVPHRVWIHTTDRSGMMLRRLEQAYPSLLERLPMTYSGRGRDEFPERLRAARQERRAAEATSAGSP